MTRLAELLGLAGGEGAALVLALALGLALLATAAIGVPAGFAVLRGLGPRTPLPAAPWGALPVLAVVALGALILFAAALALDEPGTLAGLWVVVLVLGLPAHLALLFAAAHRPAGPAALGLSRGGNARAALAGAIAYLLVLPAWYGWGETWGVLVALAGQEIAAQEVLVGILDLEGGKLAQAILLAVLVVPLLEETLFRGFLQPLLARHLGRGGGIAATALVWALLHDFLLAPPIFALGLVLGAIQDRTGRLASAWAVHGLHNGLTLALSLLASEVLRPVSSP
ncbi:MAG: type II CAAX endopeptidase family protein [Planctomycetota bacterium]